MFQGCIAFNLPGQESQPSIVSGGSKGGAPGTRLSRSIFLHFMQFLGKLSQIIGQCPHLWSCAPLWEIVDPQLIDDPEAGEGRPQNIKSERLQFHPHHPPERIFGQFKSLLHGQGHLVLSNSIRPTTKLLTRGFPKPF